jgi:hypothetical protein
MDDMPKQRFAGDRPQDLARQAGRTHARLDDGDHPDMLASARGTGIFAVMGFAH